MNDGGEALELHVRRMHRRDINRVWTFLKMVFRGVNRETVEFQRPRHKQRFIETYEDEGVEQLLFEIQSYGMDVFEEQVLRPASEQPDPLRRLEECLERNVLLLTKRRSQEIAVILHEHNTLKGDARARINARKKRYVRFLEQAFREAMQQRRIRRVNPRVAAFSFLGMVLWIYKWFRSADSANSE